MPASLAVVGARVRTLDPARPWAEAVAVHDGTVVAVGDAHDVRQVCDATTEVVDAHGAVLTPGLVDGHLHLDHGAVMGRGVNFDRVRTLDEVRDLLRARRAEVGPGAWVTGYAFEYEALGGQAFDHRLVDEACGPGPAFFYALDVHTAFANAEALRLAGVDGPRRFGDGSIVVCDDEGRPTGELRESSAMDLVADLVPRPDADLLLEWYREAVAGLNAAGLTGAHLMSGDPAELARLAALDAVGALDLRVFMHQFVHPTTGDDEFEQMMHVAGGRGRLWRADGMKFMLDGVVDTGTAWLEHPDLLGAGTDPMWPDLGLYRRRVRAVHDAGHALATHAIGDRAVREVLDVYASLPGPAGRRRVEHVETVPDATLRRFAAEGVTASVQPVHVRWLNADRTDPWSARLDHDRCSHAFRSGDLASSGAHLVLGSDWPVAPFDPRHGLFSAQTRRAHDVADERPIGTSTPLDAAQALAGYTRGPAVAAGEGDVAGRIAVGHRADLVLWADDPVAVTPADVVDLPVLATVVDGRVVHRAG